MSDEIDEEYYEDEVEINLDASHPPPPEKQTEEEALINQTINRSINHSAPEPEEEDPEIAEMKRRLREMDEEEAKHHPKSDQVTNQTGNQAHPSSHASHQSNYQPSHQPNHQATYPVVDAEELDSRSVYVGQVDYTATREELESLFSACGPVNRVTILMDKFTGQPKGFAYVEFRDADSVNAATILNDTEFKGRQLKVTPKRTNLPAFQLRGRGRGRGTFRGRGRGGYPAAPYQPAATGYGPQRGRGGGFRGRGGYAPY